MTRPRTAPPRTSGKKLPVIPAAVNEATLQLDGHDVTLTNLEKPFWPEFTKGDLLRYYAQVSPYIMPHVRDRPISATRTARRASFSS